MHGSRSRAKGPAADGTGTISSRTPYSLGSGAPLGIAMPATIAETVSITADTEGRLLSDGTNTRRQQIAGALKVGV